MFNTQKIARIQEDLTFTEFGTVRNGKTLLNGTEEITIPETEEMFQKSFHKMESLGFHVEQVNNLRKANCVLRIFSDTNLKHENTTHFMYGVDLFIKHLFSCSSSCGGELKYDYIIRVEFPKDETEDIRPDFSDYYLFVEPQNI